MPAETEAAKALSLIRDSDFSTDAHWHAAHEIAQAHEGERLFDAIHALLHRIEGDTFNAGYWDRRAGTDFGQAGFEAELAKLEDLAGTTP